MSLLFDIGKDFGIAKGAQIARDYTQDYIPVVDIEDGVLILKDGSKERFVKIMEIDPVNFDLKSEDEQDLILAAYESLLKTAPKSIQIKVETKIANTNKYIDKVRRAYDNEPNEKCKELIENYAQHLYDQTATREAIEKHYYLIFEYEKPEFGIPPATTKEIIAQVNETAEILKSEFGDMGNTVPSTADSTGGVAELLYNYYNRELCLREEYLDRVNRIYEDTMKVNGFTSTEDVGNADIRDLVAPRSLDTTANDYVVINGLYRAHMYVKANGYPSYMSTRGWLSSLSGLGYGFDTDIFYFRQNTSEKLNSLQTHIKFGRMSLNNKDEENSDYDEVVENFSGTMFMRDAIKKGGQDVYDMAVIITIHARTLEDLYKRKQFLMQHAQKIDVQLSECKRLQEDAFLSTGPFLSLSPRLFARSRHNVTTSAVRAGYPFTSFQLADPNGTLLGKHRRNGSLIFYDQFDENKYPNPNLTIFGASGAGKSYTLLTLISRMRCLGKQIFVLAPEKQTEFARVVNATGGLFIDMSPSSDEDAYRINLFDIWPLDSPEERLISGESYRVNSWLMDKIDSLRIWLKYLYKNITQGDLEILVQAIQETYSDYGITRENDSVFLDEEHTIVKEMPIFEDFFNKVVKVYGSDDKEIVPILRQFVDGPASIFNGRTNVDLNNEFVVFGLQHLKGDLQAPIMFMVLEYVWTKIRQDRTKQKVVAIDEGWLLLDGRNGSVGDFVIQIFKVIRGYRGSAIFSTQQITDLYTYGEKYANAILANSHSNILLRMEKGQVEKVQTVLELSEPEIATIKKQGQGQALLCAGANHIPIVIEASEYEHELFSTKEEDLKKLLEKNK